MKNLLIIVGTLLLGMYTQAQHVPMTRDSIHKIEEVNVTANAKKKIETEMKMAISVDEFLASSDNISFIKRGAYAWEPLLNNMSTERSEERRVGKECRSQRSQYK